MRCARYAVCRADELIADTGTVVDLGDDGDQCALFYHQGRYHALGSVCPHQNESLSGAIAKQGAATCRHHGFRFDLTTGDCLSAGGYGLPVYTVEVEDGTIYVSCWIY